MTPPEAQLWLRLRQRGVDRPVFRRQHPMGPYVIDFYCPAAKLAVEVDGWGHGMGDQPARDERRDRWLKEHGVTVVRIPAVDVTRRCEDTAMRIVETARALASGRGPPPPSLRDCPPPP